MWEAQKGVQVTARCPHRSRTAPAMNVPAVMISIDPLEQYSISMSMRHITVGS